MSSGAVSRGRFGAVSCGRFGTVSRHVRFGTVSYGIAAIEKNCNSGKKPPVGRHDGERSGPV